VIADSGPVENHACAFAANPAERMDVMYFEVRYFQVVYFDVFYRDRGYRLPCHGGDGDRE